jgi:hypothetical protein
MSYRLLTLDPNAAHMSLPVLQAIYKLVEQGAIVTGTKPSATPSLSDDQAEFQKLNDELFGDGSGVHSVGKGKVYAGEKSRAVLSALSVPLDFDYTKPQNDTRLLFVHRKLTDGDLYFIDNRSDRNQTVDASFRVTGKLPELWYAETGESRPVSYQIAAGRTTVPLSLEAWGTVFVVFRKPASAPSLTLPKPLQTQLATADGSWNLSFQPGRGAPDSITLEKLISWSDYADPEVKYFSGSGTYTSTIQASEKWFTAGSRMWMDLGDVKNLANVTVNGKALGIIWHAPYRIDVTTALKPGANQITVKVTNSWVNRLIGDQQPNVVTKYTFTDVKPYKADSPLVPSGLLGPVRLYSETR